VLIITASDGGGRACRQDAMSEDAVTTTDHDQDDQDDYDHWKLIYS